MKTTLLLRVCKSVAFGFCPPVLYAPDLLPFPSRAEVGVGADWTGIGEALKVFVVINVLFVSQSLKQALGRISNHTLYPYKMVNKNN